MVQSGKVTPEEGERLLMSLEQRTGEQRQCPYCAETIPARALVCPECESALTAPRDPGFVPQAGRGFHGLTGLGKFLVCYTFLMCGLVCLYGIGRFSPQGIPPILLALLGITGAILICKGSRTGWALGTIWAAAQIVVVVVNFHVLNRQILLWGTKKVTNGDGLGFNLVGLILIILFVKAMPKGPDSDPQKRS